MAGDWIALQKDLPRRLEVMRIAEATGLGRHEVLGMLLEFWIWADSETADGELPGIGTRSLATFWRHLGDTGETFCRALVAVGWLAERPGGLVIPRFERWMGASAKRRLQKNLSKQKGRALKAARDDAEGPQMTTSDVATPSPRCRPEKRTVESINTPLPPSGVEEARDSREDAGAYRPPGQTLEDIRGARPVRDTLSDHPHLLPAIDRVLAHYQAACAPCPGLREVPARKAVCRLLAAGETEEALKRAADRYAASCRASDTKRQAAHTFFGEAGSCAANLKAPAPLTPPPPPIARAPKLS